MNNLLCRSVDGRKPSCYVEFGDTTAKTQEMRQRTDDRRKRLTNKANFRTTCLVLNEFNPASRPVALAKHASLSPAASSTSRRQPIRDAEISCEGISITPLGAVPQRPSGYFVMPLLSRHTRCAWALQLSAAGGLRAGAGVASESTSCSGCSSERVWEQGRYRSVLFRRRIAADVFGPDLD